MANARILSDLVRLRKEQASLLGYSSHAEFVLEMRMAKNPKAVASFLQDLKVKLKPLKEKELNQFLEFKKEESVKLGFDYDGER